MVVLDNRLRAILENNIDTVMNDPKKFIKTYTIILEASGIDPKLESILSVIVGYLYGLAELWYTNIHQRHINDDEFVEVVKLMKRRAWEMRQAFISTHLEK